MEGQLMPTAFNGEKARDLNRARTDLRLAFFYKEPLSQARQLALDLGKCLHYGVWEADGGGV